MNPENETAEKGQTEASNPQEAESAEQIRAEIEATRSEMSQTIDAIQEKLDPQNIKEQIKDKVHENTVGRVQHLAHSIAENIGPAAEKVGDAGEKISDAVKPAARAAKRQGSSLAYFAKTNPALVAGAASVLGATGLFVLRRSVKKGRSHL